VSRLKNLSFWDEYIEDMRVTFKTMQEDFIAKTLAKDGTLTQKSDEFNRFTTALVS
jgi:hypothetical protein